MSVFHGVIKCYIRHITNYNFNLENEKDIISIISQSLNIKDEEQLFFIAIIIKIVFILLKKLMLRIKD